MRAAAAVALLSPLAALALGVVALAGHVALVLLGAALIVATVGVGWVAVTSRGLARAVAGTLTLLCAAGLLALLVTNWRGLAVFAGLVALLALFGASSAYALGRLRPPPTRHVAAAASPVLIVNERSGGGKAAVFDIAREAERRGIRSVVLAPGDDLHGLAERELSAGADVIGMAGGDGSLALVAGAAARAGAAFVCVPTGTRNHFALDLGLDRDHPVAALDAFADGAERVIDLAEVNGRVFVNNASLGLYANVVQSDAYRDAKLETWAQMLPDLLGRGAGAPDLTFTAPGAGEIDDAPLILVSNNRYELANPAGAGTRPRLDGAELGILATRVHTPADASALAALGMVGQPARFPGLVSWTATEFVVDSKEPVAVGLDGEALVLEPPLRFRTLPAALRVRVPTTAGPSPAARSVALSGRSLRELACVAVGR